VPVALEPASGEHLYEATAELSWAPGTAVCGATGYAVLLSPAPGGRPEVVASDLTEPRLTVSDLRPGAYRWQVVSLNADYPTPADGTPSDEATFHISPPEPPAPLAPDPRSCSFHPIELRWEGVGATSYNVFRSDDIEGPVDRLIASDVRSTSLALPADLPAGTYRWLVVAFNEVESRGVPGLPARLRICGFKRGDANGSGLVDISDAVRVFGHLFLGNPSSLDCDDAADSDDSGVLDITDGIVLLNVLFQGTGEIPSPGTRSCGADPTEDGLGCDSYPEEQCNP
jgi:hypothetical protein